MGHDAWALEYLLHIIVFVIERLISGNSYVEHRTWKVGPQRHSALLAVMVRGHKWLQVKHSLLVWCLKN